MADRLAGLILSPLLLLFFRCSQGRRLSYLEAIFLGIVQGLTEFLPVSSSGHLVIFERLLDHESADPMMIVFDLMVHVGTVAAVIVYYRRSIGKYLRHLLGSLSSLNRPLTAYRSSVSIRFSVLAMVAIVVTGLVYVLFGDFVEGGFSSPLTVAICWLITAGLLMVTDRRRGSRRSFRNFGVCFAILVGLAQGAALFPGISRSGATICVALLIGLHRRWAGEFSFLIAVPAILGATLIKSLELSGEFTGGIAVLGPMFSGALASAVVGFAALAMLIWMLKRAKLKYFALYCLMAASATMVAVAVGWL